MKKHSEQDPLPPTSSSDTKGCRDDQSASCICCISKERKNGVSLNQCLHVGPNLVPMPYDALLRIREHKVVLFGDIKQAYLNIEVATKDRDAMHFLWVDNVLGNDLQVVPYRFNRVIFGAGLSPFFSQEQ